MQKAELSKNTTTLFRPRRRCPPPSSSPPAARPPPATRHCRRRRRRRRRRCRRRRRRRRPRRRRRHSVTVAAVGSPPSDRRRYCFRRWTAVKRAVRPAANCRLRTSPPTSIIMDHHSDEREQVNSLGEGEEGAVALSGGRSRACVDFGHRRGRLRRRHGPSSTSAIVVAVD